VNGQEKNADAENLQQQIRPFRAKQAKQIMGVKTARGRVP
jgi:hypothetical protein